MRTAIEMDKYCLDNDFSFDGKSSLKHFEIIEKNLLNDEEVLTAMCPNSVYDSGEILMGGKTAVVFSSKRFICAQKSILLGEPVKVVNLEYVNDVYKETMIIFGNIKIDTIRENISFQMKKTRWILFLR